MSLDAAVRAIKAGGVIAIPTDTVYGLACDPANAAAVSRIYAIKRRPDRLELTILAASAADIEEDVDLNPAAQTLAAACWPGPLSIICALRSRRWAVPRDGTTLSVRVPDHPITLELLRRTGPLATTSANRHGQPPCLRAAEVHDVFSTSVVVFDRGPANGQPSTVVSLVGEVQCLREGAVPMTEIAALLDL